MATEREREGAARLADAMVRAGKAAWEVSRAIRAARAHGLLEFMLDEEEPGGG